MSKNSKWDKASRMEKRVIIAQEVLKLINSEKLIPSGTGIMEDNDMYCSAITDMDNLDLSSDIVEICETMSCKSDRKCTACAAGSLMLAKLNSSGEFDDCSKLDNNSINSMYDVKINLTGIFDIYELALIEAAYEKVNNNCLSKYEANCIIEWAEGLGLPKDELLILMMNNLISSGGESAFPDDLIAEEDLEDVD